MAIAEEILKKAENRKKQSLSFKPKKRRAWDFVFEKEPKQKSKLKYGNNVETIQEQNRNEAGTIQEQSRDKIGTNWEQTGNITRNITENTEPDKPQNNYNALELLCVMNGIQNKIMRQIISHIKNQPSKNYSVDIPIGILAEKVNASKESVRVSIKRLQKKNLLIRLHGEKGRYGNTKISVPENVVKKYFGLFDDQPCNIFEYGNKIQTNMGT